VICQQVKVQVVERMEVMTSSASAGSSGMSWVCWIPPPSNAGVFGCKEVGGSKEMGKYIAHFPIYPNTGKGK